MDVVHLQLGVDNIVQWLKIMKVYSSNRGFELYKDIKVTTDPFMKFTILSFKDASYNKYIDEPIN